MEISTRSWAFDRPITSPFARPHGWLGRLAGRFMLFANKQAEVVDVLDVRAGQRVLEVGSGPGGLIRLLVERTEAAHIIGVDPSPEMVAQAGRANRAAVRAGRVELRRGEAAKTGLADASVDRVVSVNTVALWPDLDAGVAELRRVARPDGTLVIAWHGGTAPNRITRSLRLAPDRLDRIEEVLGQHFRQVYRRELPGLDVFVGCCHA